MPEPLHAITLWQPWAHAIVHGPNRVENRPWAPPRWLIGKTFALHAGLHYDEAAAARLLSGHFGAPVLVPPKDKVTRGAIVGLATLDTWKWLSSLFPEPDPFAFGPFVWYLRDVVAIVPVPCRGMQKLWAVEGATLAAVRANYREALSNRAARVPEIRR